jgi:hypothetical protein
MRLLTISILSISLFITGSLSASDLLHINEETSAIELTDNTNTTADHSNFTKLLSAYVSNDGIVDYAGIKSDIATLDAYIVELQQHAPSDDWSRDEALAYWINAYNAFTLKLITDNYPLKSITDLYGGKPWDHKWIPIGGQTLSLNQIENEIIRPTYNEPRIHFAVNCAAMSCPPLANKAFTADNLESLLEERTKGFINNSAYNQLAGSPAQLSKIFEWYGKDFGDVTAFINRYKKDSLPSITSHEFTEYHWGLNGK